MKYLLIIAFLLTQAFSFGQTLNIYNSTKEAEIKKTDFLEITVKNNVSENCCDFIEYRGRYVSSSKDSVQFGFTHARINQDFGFADNPFDPHYLSDKSLKNIAKADIHYLTNNKSLEHKRFKHKMTSLGGLLVIGGFLTAVNALVVADDDRRNLLIASAVQVGAGLTIGFSFDDRSKKFKGTDDPWQFRSN